MQTAPHNHAFVAPEPRSRNVPSTTTTNLPNILDLDGLDRRRVAQAFRESLLLDLLRNAKR